MRSQPRPADEEDVGIEGKAALPPDHDDELAGSRQVILVLRLVLDRQARLHHGELVDADATCQGRFVTLRGMLHTVSRWLERQREDLTR